MKPLRELRGEMKLKPTECASSLKYISKNKIDFDVYLPSLGRNLQRDFVWTLDQKREIIMSIIYDRHIPHISVINRFDETWEIIDGKQRLSSILDFLENKFQIELENELYYFNELPDDYNKAISRFFIRYYVVYEQQTKIPDSDKITWFKFINFSGTPQDKEHLNSLK